MYGGHNSLGSTNILSSDYVRFVMIGFELIMSSDSTGCGWYASPAISLYVSPPPPARNLDDVNCRAVEFTSLSIGFLTGIGSLDLSNGLLEFSISRNYVQIQESKEGTRKLPYVKPNRRQSIAITAIIMKRSYNLQLLCEEDGMPQKGQAGTKTEIEDGTVNVRPIYGPLSK